MVFQLNVTRTELELLKRSLLISLKLPGFLQDDDDKVRLRVLLQTLERAIVAAKAQGWQGGR